MRLLVFALAALAGGTGLLVWRNMGGSLNSLSLPVAHGAFSQPPAWTPPAPAPKKAASSSKPARIAAGVSEPEQPSEIEVAASAPAPSPVQKAAPEVVWPFPIAGNIKVGAGEESVTNAYGYPSAWAVRSDDGHVIETLMYAEKHGGSATVIRITDGKVSSAYTKASPNSPPGSLVRDLEQANPSADTLGPPASSPAAAR